jgi:hypothetical protein
MTVSDTAGGIRKAEFLNEVIDPDTGTKTKVIFIRGSSDKADTGILSSGHGLATARKFALDFGGDIDVESTTGVGTTFTVRIPLNQAEESEAAAAGAVGEPSDDEVRRISGWIGSPGANVKAEATEPALDTERDVRIFTADGKLSTRKIKTLRRLGSGLAGVVYETEDVTTGQRFVEKYYGNVTEQSLGKRIGRTLRNFAFAIFRGTPPPFMVNIYAVLANQYTSLIIGKLLHEKFGYRVTPAILYTRYDEETGGYVQAFEYIEHRPARVTTYTPDTDWRDAFRLGEAREAINFGDKINRFLEDEVGLWGPASQVRTRMRRWWTWNVNLNAPNNIVIEEATGRFIALDFVMGIPRGIVFAGPFEMFEWGYFIKGLVTGNFPVFADAIDFVKLDLYTSRDWPSSKNRDIRMCREWLRFSVNKWRQSEPRKGYRIEYLKTSFRKIWRLILDAKLLEKIRAAWNRIPDWAKTLWMLLTDKDYRFTIAKERIEQWLDEDLKAAEVTAQEKEVMLQELEDKSNFALISILGLLIGLKMTVGVLKWLGIGVAVSTSQWWVALGLFFMDGVIRAVLTVALSGLRYPVAILVGAFPMIGNFGIPAQMIKTAPHLGPYIIRKMFAGAASKIPGLGERGALVYILANKTADVFILFLSNIKWLLLPTLALGGSKLAYEIAGRDQNMLVSASLFFATLLFMFLISRMHGRLFKKAPVLNNVPSMPEGQSDSLRGDNQDDNPSSTANAFGRRDFLKTVVAGAPFVLAETASAGPAKKPRSVGHEVIDWGDVIIDSTTADLPNDSELEILPCVSYAGPSGFSTSSLAKMVTSFQENSDYTVLAAFNSVFFDLISGSMIGCVFRDSRMIMLNMPEGVVRTMAGIVPPKNGTGSRLLIASPDEMPRCWVKVKPGADGDIIAHGVNVTRGNNGYVIYTPDYGYQTPRQGSGIEIIIKELLDSTAVFYPNGPDNKRYKVEKIIRGTIGGTPIPKNGFVVSLEGWSKRYVDEDGYFVEGKALERSWSLPTGWQEAGVTHAIAVGPRLIIPEEEGGVVRGKIFVTAHREGLTKVTGNVRMAVAVTRSGKARFIRLRHPNHHRSLDYHRVANILLKLWPDDPVVNAMCLDGGSSAAALYRDAERLRVLYEGRAVPAGIMVARRNTPTKPPATALKPEILDDDIYVRAADREDTGAQTEGDASIDPVTCGAGALAATVIGGGLWWVISRRMRNSKAEAAGATGGLKKTIFSRVLAAVSIALIAANPALAQAQEPFWVKYKAWLIAGGIVFGIALFVFAIIVESVGISPVIDFILKPLFKLYDRAVLGPLEKTKEASKRLAEWFSRQNIFEKRREAERQKRSRLEQKLSERADGHFLQQLMRLMFNPKELEHTIEAVTNSSLEIIRVVAEELEPDFDSVKKISEDELARRKAAARANTSNSAEASATGINGRPLMTQDESEKGSIFKNFKYIFIFLLSAALFFLWMNFLPFAYFWPPRLMHLYEHMYFGGNNIIYLNPNYHRAAGIIDHLPHFEMGSEQKGDWTDPQTMEDFGRTKGYQPSGFISFLSQNNFYRPFLRILVNSVDSAIGLLLILLACKVKNIYAKAVLEGIGVAQILVVAFGALKDYYLVKISDWAGGGPSLGDIGESAAEFLGRSSSVPFCAEWVLATLLFTFVVATLPNCALSGIRLFAAGYKSIVNRTRAKIAAATPDANDSRRISRRDFVFFFLPLVVIMLFLYFTPAFRQLVMSRLPTRWVIAIYKYDPNSDTRYIAAEVMNKRGWPDEIRTDVELFDVILPQRISDILSEDQAANTLRAMAENPVLAERVTKAAIIGLKRNQASCVYPQTLVKTAAPEGLAAILELLEGQGFEGPATKACFDRFVLNNYDFNATSQLKTRYIKILKRLLAEKAGYDFAAGNDIFGAMRWKAIVGEMKKYNPDFSIPAVTLPQEIKLKVKPKPMQASIAIAPLKIPQTPGAKAEATGLDGKEYEQAFVDPAGMEESARRLKFIQDRIEQAGANWGSPPAQNAVAVARVEWLLKTLLERGEQEPNGYRYITCTDFVFLENMPSHLSGMPRIVPDVIKILQGPNAKPSPELLIAAMFHDADRLFDGYYIRSDDEGTISGDSYTNYVKPIQHPALAAELAMPLLRQLGIDSRILAKAEILIRNHETGIDPSRVSRPEGMSEDKWQRLISDSKVLKAADAVSYFTPDIITNALKDQKRKGDAGQFAVEVKRNYQRLGDSRLQQYVVGQMTTAKQKGKFAPVETAGAETDYDRCAAFDIFMIQTGQMQARQDLLIKYGVYENEEELRQAERLYQTYCLGGELTVYQQVEVWTYMILMRLDETDIFKRRLNVYIDSITENYEIVNLYIGYEYSSGGEPWRKSKWFVGSQAMDIHEKLEEIRNGEAQNREFLFIEIGCGGGADLIELAYKRRHAAEEEKSILNFLGLDANPYNIRAAVERLANMENPPADVRFKVRDCRSAVEGVPNRGIPCADNEADAVLMLDGTLDYPGYEPPWVKAICAEVARVIKPGGRIGFTGRDGEKQIVGEFDSASYILRREKYYCTSWGKKVSQDEDQPRWVKGFVLRADAKKQAAAGNAAGISFSEPNELKNEPGVFRIDVSLAGKIIGYAIYDLFSIDTLSLRDIYLAEQAPPEIGRKFMKTIAEEAKKMKKGRISLVCDIENVPSFYMKAARDIGLYLEEEEERGEESRQDELEREVEDEESLHEIALPGLYETESPPPIEARIPTEYEIIHRISGPSSESAEPAVIDKQEAVLLKLKEIRRLVSAFVTEAIKAGKKLVLIFDLDKTLSADSKSPIDDKTAERLAAAIKNGFYIIISTQRDMGQICSRVLVPMMNKMNFSKSVMQSLGEKMALGDYEGFSAIFTKNCPNLIPLPHAGMEQFPHYKLTSRLAQRHTRLIKECLKQLSASTGTDFSIDIEGTWDESGNLWGKDMDGEPVLLKESGEDYGQKNYLIVIPGKMIKVALYRTKEERSEAHRELVEALDEAQKDKIVLLHTWGGRATVDIAPFGKLTGIFYAAEQICKRENIQEEDLAIIGEDDGWRAGQAGLGLLYAAYDFEGLAIAPLGEKADPQEKIPEWVFMTKADGPRIANTILEQSLKRYSALAAAAGAGLTVGTAGVQTTDQDPARLEAMDSAFEQAQAAMAAERHAAFRSTNLLIIETTDERAEAIKESLAARWRLPSANIYAIAVQPGQAVDEALRQKYGTIPQIDYIFHNVASGEIIFNYHSLAGVIRVETPDIKDTKKVARRIYEFV